MVRLCGVCGEFFGRQMQQALRGYTDVHKALDAVAGRIERADKLQVGPVRCKNRGFCGGVWLENKGFT